MTHYYFRILEKVTAGLLDMFNSIYVKQQMYTKSTNIWGATEYRVPIEIGTKDKILRDFEYLYKNDGIKRYYNVPKFILVFNSMDKSDERQTNQLNVIKNSVIENDEDGKKILRYVKNPSWYNTNYTLNIITRRMDDMTQIIEQILPIFQPQYSLNIKLIPEINLTVSLPTTISNQLAFEINQDLEATNIRFIMTEISLKIPVPVFPPISDAKIINKIITRFSVVQNFSEGMNTNAQEEFNLYGEQAKVKPLLITSDMRSSWNLSRSFITKTIRMT